MIRTNKNFALGALWAIFAIVIWAGSLVLLRFGAITHLNAYDLTALRFGLAGLLLLPIVVRQGFARDRLGLKGLFVMIGGFGAPYIILISYALRSAPASAAGAVNPGIMAVSSVLLGAVAFKDKVGVRHVVGILSILMGLLIPVLLSSAGFTVGQAILVLTGLMWASYALIVRKSGIAALHATAIVAVGSAAVYMPVYILFLPKQIAEAPGRDILVQMGFQGVLVSIFALYAFNRSSELLGPVTGSTLPALIPLVTLLMGFIVLDEQAGSSEAIVAIAIGIGVALILSARKHVSSSQIQ
ncbi:DMT family transporter [Roseibium polysiphoniae]|uniref:DMT family transporter n=1 Tax=Roseibium polysiphoniae TaxID=2571221 RepID=A0A944CFH8_9HYPH|nr:DMT family transporter [Roseibium polysiphoniae]MBS8261632.1 DMT family transporter [Roseibium polysiphoniae]